MTEPSDRPTSGTILGRARRSDTDEAREVEASFAGLAAEPVDEEAESAPPPGEPTSPQAANAGGVRWPLVGCVMFALAALVFAVLGLQQRSALQRAQQQSSQLRDVSGRTIAALTSYDYQHLDQWKKAVLVNATGSFQNQFEAGFTGFEQTYIAEHNRATGAVQGVWVGNVEAGKASAVVLVQITVTSLTGTHSLEPYVQLTLLKVAGQWRVDDVQATFDTSGGGGSASSSPTPTVPNPAPPAGSPASSAATSVP